MFEQRLHQDTNWFTVDPLFIFEPATATISNAPISPKLEISKTSVPNIAFKYPLIITQRAFLFYILCILFDPIMLHVLALILHHRSMLHIVATPVKSRCQFQRSLPCKI